MSQQQQGQQIGPAKEQPAHCKACIQSSELFARMGGGNGAKSAKVRVSIHNFLQLWMLTHRSPPGQREGSGQDGRSGWCVFVLTLGNSGFCFVICLIAFLFFFLSLFSQLAAN
jgi:hypothetical protein